MELLYIAFFTALVAWLIVRLHKWVVSRQARNLPEVTVKRQYPHPLNAKPKDIDAYINSETMISALEHYETMIRKDYPNADPFIFTMIDKRITQLTLQL